LVAGSILEGRSDKKENEIRRIAAGITFFMVVVVSSNKQPTDLTLNCFK
jgi:hypothetical protein